MKNDISFVETIRLGCDVSFGVELLQFLINYFLVGRRGAEIADMVVNSLGAALGYLLVKALVKNQSSSSIYQSFKLYA